MSIEDKVLETLEENDYTVHYAIQGLDTLSKVYNYDLEEASNVYAEMYANARDAQLKEYGVTSLGPLAYAIPDLYDNLMRVRYEKAFHDTLNSLKGDVYV